MTQQTKTDNGALEVKLALRRRFLDAYPLKTHRVFDACQGSGVLWGTLQTEYPCDYWGVDVKPKSGRLLVDSRRILDLPDWGFDVVDVDTYGRPWDHWDAILRRFREPLTVFLTIGITGTQGSAMHRKERRALGVSAKVPHTLLMRHIDHAIGALVLTNSRRHARITEAVEAYASTVDRTRWQRTRYLGIRLEPL